MNEFETGILNSSLILNYLLRQKNCFTLYLEDGSKLSGTLLGWDADFLLIKEGRFLQMIRITTILRLQAEFDQIVAMDSTAIREEPKPLSHETDMNDATKVSLVGGVVSKFKPTLTEVKPVLAESQENESPKKNEFKDKLDHLVKNW